MKRLLSLLMAVAALAVTTTPAYADSISVNFEGPQYVLGNINGQNGWSSTGIFDQGVVSSPVISGSQSFRISNAVTSGSFGDQTFSPTLSQPAGESGSDNSSYGPGPFQSHFESTFSIKVMADSIGDVLSVSPDQGAGARMSYLRFENLADGIHVYFDDILGATNPANFNETALLTLDPSVSHVIKFSMDFIDGPSNDVVKIYIDGNLVHTGTSWENYYRFDDESNPSLNTNFTPTVRTMLFRAGGAAVPTNLGKGYLIDDLTVISGPVLVGPPTNKDQCKKDGWKSFNNPVFKNQGKCVSFVEKSKEDKEDKREHKKEDKNNENEHQDNDKDDKHDDNQNRKNKKND